MDTIEYNGKKYPTRTLNMSSEETGEVTNTIADSTLLEAMVENSAHLQNSEEKAIDESIYFYVQAGVLDLTPQEICEKHLDIPFEYIAEFEE